jgi:protein ImuB
VTREVRPARPLARAAPLFEQCRALLERWTPGAPICGVAVALTATAPSGAEQGDLLDTSWRDAAAADAAFARLRAALGPDVVVRPVKRDEHKPERAGGWHEGETGSCHPARAERVSGSTVLADGAGPMTGRVDPDTPSLCSVVRDDTTRITHPLALRLLESPEPIDVEAADGAPATLWWRGRRIGVAHADGPERLSGEWWRGGYRRDYWRCEEEPDGPTGRGVDFLVYLERGTAPCWWMHGWYD